MNILAQCRWLFLVLMLAACHHLSAPSRIAGDTVETVPIGQTIEYLLASEGSPTSIKQWPGKHGLLESYYYRQSHTSYIVNKETGYICNATAGKHTGSCPPLNE